MAAHPARKCGNPGPIAAMVIQEESPNRTIRPHAAQAGDVAHD